MLLTSLWNHFLNVPCGVCLGTGFGLGILLGLGSAYLARWIRSRFPRGPLTSHQESIQTLERVLLATARLRDLASGVASDSASHTSQIREISSRLKSLPVKDGGAAAEAVMAAIAKMLEANNDLQFKRAEAEKQIDTQAEAIRSHETRALTDSLTNLANRRAFDEELKRRFSEWNRKKTPVSLAILDVDHFKKLNDTYGHPAGDEVLRQMARSLVETCRTMDIACRYGGEEFAIILPASTSAEASRFAERARLAIAKQCVQVLDKKLNVTVSIGVAQAGPEETSSSLIHRADEALYRSKRAGRNCAYLHDGQQCVPLTSAVVEGKLKQEAAPKAVPSAELPKQLPNRQRFLDEAYRRIAECNRSGAPLSVIYLYLDEHVEIQRRFGSEAVDVIVRALPESIAESIRDMDLLAQIGVGEFAVLAPLSRQYDAEQIANRVCSAFTGRRFTFGNFQLPLVLRYGVAEFQSQVDTPQTLLERARRSAAKAATEQAATLS